jgi:sterol desaturase/sphingolipid hydroxylase (fatty acid hydroxylase superfamily)
MTAEEAWAKVWVEFRALLAQGFSDAGSLFTPLVLSVTLVICAAIYLWRRPREGFLAWLFPRRAYRTQGFLLDVQIYLLSSFVVAHAVLAAPAVAAVVMTGIGALAATAWAPTAEHPFVTALVTFLTADAFSYAWHRLHHENRVLWPLHALHHAAEELTPLTAVRHHPVFVILGNAIYAVLLGTLQALALLFILGRVDVLTALGINVFYAGFNLAAANLRHSHVWLRYPAWLEHLLISPAQHQVHHSIDPRHHDRNYGEVLAVWDWLCGTLYVPGQEEAGVAFGLADAEGRRLPQPYGSFRKAMLVPLAEAWRAFARRGGNE